MSAHPEAAASPAPEPARARLAVLIPVYNDQAGLERSLQSLARDGADFDVVVVDDGSTPPLQVPADPPFRVVLCRLARNRGITGALNAGLAHIAAAGYPYVARLDSSDISLPGRMAAQMAFLDANPDHAVIGGWAEWVDLKGQRMFVFRPPVEDAALRSFQHYRVGLVHPAVTIRMPALVETGFYEDRFSGAEEYDLFLRLARRHKLANLPEVLVNVEFNPKSLSSRRFRQGLIRLQVQAAHFAPSSPHAWLGFARNVLLLFIPRNLMAGIKQRLARQRGDLAL